MAPWMWFLLGVVLLAVELATPGGFYFLFFGVGALVVGILALTVPFLSPTGQWLLFSVVASLSLLLFRKALLQRLRPRPSDGTAETLVGETAITVEPIEACGYGRAELHGSTWQARNLSDTALPARQRCRVARVEGLTLYLMEE